MGVLYYSTRGDKQAYTASQAILQGLAKDGGLFVPDALPKLDKTMEELSAMDYKEVAYEVMKQFLTDYTEEELKTCIKNAYNDRFDTPAIAPTVKKAGAYYLELFHGPTIAFKDMALSILPHLMVTAAKKNNCDKEIVILTATSGDTGKAAMAGFADVPGTRIVVFYPKGGVSAVQEKQMVTQKGKNVKVVGIHGNFDDAQSRVKALFGDKELEKELDECMNNTSKRVQWIEYFRQFENISEIDRSTVIQLIMSIHIYDKKHLQITFNYKDEYEQAVAALEAYKEAK